MKHYFPNAHQYFVSKRHEAITIAVILVTIIIIGRQMDLLYIHYGMDASKKKKIKISA